MTAEIIKTMKETIGHFLEEHRQTAHPVLIGFSGGGDSIALTHLLLEAGCEIALAHFDHGWRSESRDEAKELELYADRLGITFYTKRADYPDKTENGARNQRWEFFKELFIKGSFEALALAHHLEDQAETVLKRTLEGAHLHNFVGMQPFGSREGIAIWRPLLCHSKGELAVASSLRRISPVDDSTNSDPRYLRARMREELFPNLNATFGKNVVAPLARLGEKGKQLTDYLEMQTRDRIVDRDERGIFINLNGAHPIEIDFVLSRAPFPTPSHHSLKIIHRAILNGESRVWAAHDILVDKGVVIWTKMRQTLVN